MFFSIQKLGEQKKSSEETGSIRSSPELLTPREVTTPQKTTTTTAGVKDPLNEMSARQNNNHISEVIEDSMTPPLSIRATSIPGEDDLEEGVKGDDNDEMGQTNTATKVAAAAAAATAPKKNEWDMFAEQDLESNFDVSEGVQ